MNAMRDSLQSITIGLPHPTRLQIQGQDSGEMQGVGVRLEKLDLEGTNWMTSESVALLMVCPPGDVTMQDS